MIFFFTYLKEKMLSLAPIHDHGNKVCGYVILVTPCHLYLS